MSFSPARSPRLEDAPKSSCPKTASGVIVTTSSSEVRSSVSSAVMIFVRLAMGRRASGALANIA